MAVPVAAIAKKAAEILAGSKNGRKFIGYTVGIVIFLLLLPVIVIFGMFGWMSGDGGMIIDQSQVIAAMPSEQQEEWRHQDEVLQSITDIFTEQGLVIQIRKAQAIYISALSGKEKDDEKFYSKYADCFAHATEETTVYDNIKSTFDVSFSEKDISDLNEIYG